MRNKTFKHLLPILLIALSIGITACSKNDSQTKRDLQSTYVRSIIGNKCDNAEKAYNEMVKIDPQDQTSLRYYSSFMGKDVVTISYNDLSTYVGHCKAGTPNLIPVNELRKSLEILTTDSIDYKEKKAAPLMKGIEAVSDY